MVFRSGRHVLQLPGPTNVPDRVLRAMDRPVIDHRGPAFAEMAGEILAGLGPVFGTAGHVLVYPASGSGAWEAAIANTLSPGDGVLMFDRGVFAAGWQAVARRFGLDVDFVAGDWRRGVTGDEVREKLAADRGRRYQAVMVVHNETSTGVTSDIAAVRRAMDDADHPALLMVDAVSSLAAVPFLHDAWRVDVTVAGSQKGLMLPPGLGFNAVSEKALARGSQATLPRSYWDWEQMLRFNADGFFPYTPATNLLFGLREALAMLEEEGRDAVYARHARLAEATRRAVAAWGLETYCADPRACSNSLTAVSMPEGHDADALRRVILDRYDMSLGAGLGKLKGKVFRIGHLGDINDLMLAGALCGVEMGLAVSGVAPAGGGVAAALRYLAEGA